MSWELQRHQWSVLKASDSASGVPVAIKALQSATTDESALEAYWQLDNTVVVQGAVYEAALATIQCLLSSLLECTRIARPRVLELMVQIGSGEPAMPCDDASEMDIVERCRKEITHGMAIFLKILEQSSDDDECSFCIDLLGLCCRADSTLQARVLWYFEKIEARGLSEGLHRLVASWRDEFVV